MPAAGKAGRSSEDQMITEKEDGVRGNSNGLILPIHQVLENLIFNSSQLTHPRCSSITGFTDPFRGQLPSSTDLFLWNSSLLVSLYDPAIHISLRRGS
jgi:hypothetical protein